MVTAEDVRAFALTLPRAYEAVVRDRVKFRIVRYHWVRCWLAEIELDELHELILDAWRMVVPKKVWREYIAAHPQWSDTIGVGTSTGISDTGRLPIAGSNCQLPTVQ